MLRNEYSVARHIRITVVGQGLLTNKIRAMFYFSPWRRKHIIWRTPRDDINALKTRLLSESQWSSPHVHLGVHRVADEDETGVEILCTD